MYWPVMLLVSTWSVTVLILMHVCTVLLLFFFFAFLCLMLESEKQASDNKKLQKNSLWWILCHLLSCCRNQNKNKTAEQTTLVSVLCFSKKTCWSCFLWRRTGYSSSQKTSLLCQCVALKKFWEKCYLAVSIFVLDGHWILLSDGVLFNSAVWFLL